MDINFRTPATAQAAGNIIRCALAAIAVAVLEAVMSQIGIGWTFTLLGLGTFGSGFLYWVDRRWGMRWWTESMEGHETTEGHGTTEATDTPNEKLKEPEPSNRSHGGLEGSADEVDMKDWMKE